MGYKLPFMKFYFSDWKVDTGLLTLATRGAWIDILGILWNSETRGKKTLSLNAWSRALSATENEVILAFQELAKNGICNILKHESNTDVTVSSRRLEREENERENTRERVSEFRKKRKCNAKLTPEKSDTRYQKLDTRDTLTPIIPLKKTHIIPDDLIADKEQIETWLAYKKERGKPYKPIGLNALWSRLRSIPQERRAPAIMYSMAQNWAGIFEEKENGKAKNQSTGITPPQGKYANVGS